MKEYSDNMPDPKEIERKLSEFLSKEFGGEVKVMSPVTLPQELSQEQLKSGKTEKKRIHFDLKPRELIAWLDQYIVRQDHAKAVLATKICTHFNRIMHEKAHTDDSLQLTGRIKNNVLMMGPTGVGKTYMVKLIARKIGVPFVKGDATKFSETGYVGGDVEDLVRDLVREADDDLELAQYGIIYIDEIDKIASGGNLIGADISRTGVQRALLKPMEETEVDMKVPHDPISMIQEIERFRKTGKRTGNTVNTRNILFIMSGAFSGLDAIISKRLTSRKIGFGAQIQKNREQAEMLRQVRSEDLVEFGFESEFVGRLPVHAVLERLSEEDLFDILKNPNNPVILGKKLDFAAYNIRIKFADDALRLLARRAYRENTGARGLVSAIERALLPFETELPSLESPVLPVTEDMIREPGKYLKQFRSIPDAPEIHEAFDLLCREEKEYIMAYADENRHTLMQRHSLGLTPSRIDILADYYVSHIMDIDSVIRKIKACSDEIKKAELFFYKTHDINIVMEEDAIDYMIGRLIHGEVRLEEFHKKLSLDFEYGLKLVRDRIGKNRFFITRDALIQPEAYIASLLKTDTELADKGIGKK